MTSKALLMISEVMAMLPVTLVGARLARGVMVLKSLSPSEQAAEDSLHFKNVLVGKV